MGVTPLRHGRRGWPRRARPPPSDRSCAPRTTSRSCGPPSSALSSPWARDGPMGHAESLPALGHGVAPPARTTVPLIIAGVLLSSLLIDLLPVDRLREAPLRIAAVLLVALVSLPLALPTFAEIPLALGLLA